MRWLQFPVAALAALLAEFGHDVRIANDGEAGVVLAAEHAPDAVLLDIGLPGINGYEVARRLRGTATLANVTLVGLSGYSQEEDRRRAREAGFDHYLIKPIDAAELINILDALPVTAKDRGHRPIRRLGKLQKELGSVGVPEPKRSILTLSHHAVVVGEPRGGDGSHRSARRRERIRAGCACAFGRAGCFSHRRGS